MDNEGNANVIDFGCGANNHMSATENHIRTGTLDTMARAFLEELQPESRPEAQPKSQPESQPKSQPNGHDVFSDEADPSVIQSIESPLEIGHHLHHDFESLSYVIVKCTTEILMSKNLATALKWYRVGYMDTEKQVILNRKHVYSRTVSNDLKEERQGVLSKYWKGVDRLREDAEDADGGFGHKHCRPDQSCSNEDKTSIDFIRLLEDAVQGFERERGNR